MLASALAVSAAVLLAIIPILVSFDAIVKVEHILNVSTRRKAVHVSMVIVNIWNVPPAGRSWLVPCSYSRLLLSVFGFLAVGIN